MGLLDKLLSRREVNFAQTLAEKIFRQFPPASEPQLIKKGAQRRLEAILEMVMKDLETFQEQQKLSWLGKARLANTFRWQLTDRGYSKQFVEALTEGIVQRIVVK